jgi:hypothetical protein
MAKDPQHNPDPSENAARIVAESTADSDSLPADVEAAWAEWSRHIQKDERGMELLRAAFESGFEAAATGSAAVLGRLGGLKGGKSRADKLSAEQRSEIARKAAAARWNNNKKP